MRRRGRIRQQLHTFWKFRYARSSGHRSQYWNGHQLQVFCGLYLPGHEVHLIRLLKYINSDDHRVPGRLIEASDDGIILVEFDNEVRRYWNHEPKLLAHLAGQNNNHVELQERGGLLGTRIKNGYWPFYLADPDDHRECPDTPPTGTALELLESAGGFLISASELTAQLAD